jgi:hypothetical protein
MVRATFALTVLCCAACACLGGVDDLVFIHHSCGQNWLSNSLNSALLAKDYVDERNDIYYGVDAAPDAGRPDTLAPTPGDHTDMCHWIHWFNNYLGDVKSHGCATGVNRIVMYKSCYPNSNVTADGTGGDPFSTTQTLANYKAVYRHPDGAGHTYSHGGHTYRPLEDIFAADPNTLFVAVTAPPLSYGTTGTNDANAHRARLFNNWLKTDWLNSYNAANPGLHNVAVFDWFDVLAYPDDHATHPNRLKQEYGGASADSHPNSTANAYSTQVFATDEDNFIDQAWDAFDGPATYGLTVTNGSGSGQYEAGQVVPIQANPPGSGKAFAGWMGDYSFLADRTAAATTVTMPAQNVSVIAAYVYVYHLTVNSGTGGGDYPNGTVVAIQADPAMTWMVFDQWTGDVSRVSDPSSSAATVTMPSQAVTVTATYAMLPVPGDLDGSGFVGQADLDIVLANWGFGPPPDPRADPSGDDFVGQADLDIVLAHWGQGIRP